MPNMQKKMVLIERLPIPKPRSRNRRGSRVGNSVCVSHTTNPMPKMIAEAKATTTPMLPQPHSGPSMIPNTSEPRASTETNAPMGSRGCPSGSREVGTMKPTRTMSRRTSGMLIRKTELQPNHLSIRPLSNGPMAPPAPARPAQVATALARSWGGNEFWMIESVAGMTSAAPMPMTARAPMRVAAESAREAMKAQVPKITRPVSSAPLRPNRSPMAPAGRRNPAKTRA